MTHSSAQFSSGQFAWRTTRHKSVIEPSGELGVLEFGSDFSFDVKRVFFLRDVSADVVRGAHSHQELNQLIICLSGSLIINLDCGEETQSIALSADNTCLYLDGKVWREMHDFSTGTILLVLCDREYRYDKVVRSYEEFLTNLKI
jgi:dTDP-4-dehydrorhamnose 3,5-epimerase-like enzyme